MILLCIKEIMEEVSRREKQAGVTPEPDIDTYMKVNYILQKPVEQSLILLLIIFILLLIVFIQEL